jgi:hypothetical protein
VGAFSGVAGSADTFRAELPVGATQSATGAVLLTVALLWRFAAAQRDRWRARNQPPSTSAGSTTVPAGSSAPTTSPASERASTASAPRTDAA